MSINENDQVVEENPQVNNKTTGNPDKTIERVSANQPPKVPTYEQAVDIENIDKAIMENLLNIAKSCDNFVIKYSEVAGDFKKIGEALKSYAQVLEQKMIYENNQKKKQPPET